MIRFDWNGLRVGDAVLVHQLDGAAHVLMPGSVAFVNMRKGRSARKGSNGVGIRVALEDGARIIWPSMLTVHAERLDPSEPCWRCEAVSAPSVDADYLLQRPASSSTLPLSRPVALA